MGNTLYLECSSGISGDMTVAALLDLGADQQILRKALASLPVEGYEIVISRVKKSGLDVCDFHVQLDHAHENHDHDMEYLHGHQHAEGREHTHGEHTEEHEHVHEKHAEEHEHVHGEHGEEHEHVHGEHAEGHDHVHSHHHEHRGLPEIQEIICGADLTDGARKTALKIFDILAAAEAKAHGVPMDQVRFHEVGAVDSIVDIVAAAVCLDNLDITDAIIPHLCEGQGFVRCQHGVIPVPVPAVLNIVQANQLRLQLTDVKGELVTPTGAAIAAAIKTSDQLPEQFQTERIGIGAGKRTYERPSLLRAMLIRPANTRTGEDMIYRLESNIDDSTGESLGYCMERLLEAGARDVWYTPIYMKKNRPAYQLNVIATKDELRKLEQIIFEETTTIGIRRMELERTILPREKRTIRTSLGSAEVKVCVLPNGETRLYPEYESVRLLARESGLPFRQAFEIVRQEADKSV